MKIPRAPHRWQLAPRDAIAVQQALRGQVRRAELKNVEHVVGLDCAFSAERVYAVAVVWSITDARVVETRGASGPLEFPYVPGLLSFRELPVLLKVLRRVRSRVDAVLCDGQGIAHPRRFGIASHLGVILDQPSVGCAKSRLIGEHDTVPLRRGAKRVLRADFDGKPETIGSVVCTRTGVKPVYVSPGHRCDFDSAVRLVLECAVRYRLPEPTRLADRLVAEFKRDGYFRGSRPAK